MWPFKNKIPVKEIFILNKKIEYKNYCINVWAKAQEEVKMCRPFGNITHDLYFTCGWSDSAGGGYYHTGISGESLNNTIDGFILKAKDHIDFVIEKPEILLNVKSKLEKFK